MTLRIQCCFTLLLVLLGPSAWAAAADITIGPAAENANAMLSGVIELIAAVLYISSLVMFTSCILKFRIHFQNPQQIPLSTPITELVLAIVLGCLPMITELTTRGMLKESPSVLQPFMQ